MSRQRTHGVKALDAQRTAWRKGVPLPSDTMAAVEAVAAELAADRPEPPTALERELLRDAALCVLIRRGVLAEMERRGSIFGPDGDLLAPLTRVLSYANTYRLNALALGLKPERVERVAAIEPEVVGPPEASD